MERMSEIRSMRWCFFLSFIVSCLCVNLVIIGAQNLCPNKFEQICLKERFQRFEGIFRRLSRSWQLGGLVPAFRLGWKRYFLPIFECFWSFSTMQMHAQACVRWSKYTTDTYNHRNSVAEWSCSELCCIQSQIWQYCGLNEGILGTKSPKYVC